MIRRKSMDELKEYIEGRTYENLRERHELIREILDWLKSEAQEPQSTFLKKPQFIQELDGLAFFLQEILVHDHNLFPLKIKFPKGDNATDFLIREQTHSIVEVVSDYSVDKQLQAKIRELNEKSDIIGIVPVPEINPTTYNNFCETKKIESKVLTTILAVGRLWFFYKDKKGKLEIDKDKWETLLKELKKALERVNKGAVERAIGYTVEGEYVFEACANLIADLSVHIMDLASGWNSHSGRIQRLDDAFKKKSHKSREYKCCDETIEHKKILLMKINFFTSQGELEDFYSILKEKFKEWQNPDKYPHQFSAAYITYGLGYPNKKQYIALDFEKGNSKLDVTA